MISIIVPIYNSELFIDACIDSIINQSYPDFELLLVDDGSTDSSFQKCQQWVKKDSRIRLYRKENSGASSARNMGLHEAKGDWILFVDSDDTVMPDYVYDLYKEVQTDSRVIMVIGGLLLLRNNKLVDKRVFIKQLCNVRDSISLFGNIRIHKYGFSVSKLYNRKVISDSDLRFDENVCIAEDSLFMMRYLMYCYQNSDSYVAFTDSADYMYSIRKNSLSTGIGSVSNELYSYNEYKRTISEVRVTYSMDDITFCYMNSPIVYFADRLINSIYKNIPSSSKDRIRLLKAIDLNEYKKYKKTKTVVESVLVSLLSSGFYYCYDLLRRVLL